MTKHGPRAVPEPETSAAAFALSAGMPSDVRQRLIADLEPRHGRRHGRRLLAAAEPTIPGVAGERIAHLALTALRDAFEHASEDSTPLALGRAFAVADAVVRARNRLHEAGAEAPRILVGITAAVIEGRIVTIAQVPPHRAILVQDGRCYPLPGSEWAERGAGEDDEVEPYPLGSDAPVAPRLVRSAITGDDLLILADSCLIDHLGRDGRRLGPGDRAIARDVDRILTWMEGVAWRHGLDDVMGACLTLPVSEGTSPLQNRPRAPWLVPPLSQSTVSSLSAIVTGAPTSTGESGEPAPPVETPADDMPGRPVTNRLPHDSVTSDREDGLGTGLVDDGSPDQPDGADVAAGPTGSEITPTSRESTLVDGTGDRPGPPGLSTRETTEVRDTPGTADTLTWIERHDATVGSGAGDVNRGGLASDDAVREATLAAAAAWWHSAASRQGRQAAGGRRAGPGRRWDGSETPGWPRAGTAPVTPGVIAPGEVSGTAVPSQPPPIMSPSSREGVSGPRPARVAGGAAETIRVVTGPRGRAAFFPGGLSTLPGAQPHRCRVGSLTRLLLVALALTLICGSSAVAHDQVSGRNARARASRDALAGLDAAIAGMEVDAGATTGGPESGWDAMLRAETAGIAESDLAPRRLRLRQLTDDAAGIVRLGNVSRVGLLPVEITGDAATPPRLVRAGRDLYLVANGLYSVSLSDSRLVAALAPGSEIDGRVVGPLIDGAWNTAGLVVTDGQAAYRMRGNEWTAHSLDDMPESDRQGPCATLDAGFYVLDAGDGTILKTDLTSGDDRLAAWTAGQTPSLRDAKAVVIDGRVHVLRADGSVATLESGEIVIERSLAVEPPVTAPITMTGGLDSTVLWVLDRAGDELRVIRTDPDTGETRAFLFDTPVADGQALTAVTGMAVDEVNHTVYLLGPDALWRADLPVYVPALATGETD